MRMKSKLSNLQPTIKHENETKNTCTADMTQLLSPKCIYVSEYTFSKHFGQEWKPLVKCN